MLSALDRHRVLARILRRMRTIPWFASWVPLFWPCISYSFIFFRASGELTSSLPLHQLTALQVNGADIVPRLTVNALLPYFTTCRYVKSLNTTKRRLIDMGMQSIAVDWEHLISSSKKDLEVARNEMDASRLFVPGIVLQMVEPKDVQRQDAALLHLFSDVKVDVIRVPRTDFVRVRREKGMFMMHAPHRYRQSLMSALKELGGEPLRRKANSGGLLRSLMQLPTSRVMDSSTVAGDSDANPLRPSRKT
jgi:hypothetical protein